MKQRKMDYKNKISLFLKSLQQPILQIIFYLMIYELIIASFISKGFLKMNLGLGIASRYLFYLYVILSLVLLFVTFLQKTNRFIYSFILIIAFFIISFYNLKDSTLFALLIWANVVLSTFLAYLVTSKSIRKR